MDAAKQERVRERMRQAEAEGVAAAKRVDKAGFIAKLQAWRASDAAVMATWKHRRPDLPDQTLAGYDVELCRLAAGAGWSDADLAELIAAHHAAYGGAKEGRRADYVARTIASARSQQDDTAARPNGAGGPQQVNGEDRGAHAGDAGGDQQEREGAAKFTVGYWLQRDLPAPDFLLGELFSTTSRVMLVGPTGAGKSNLAIALNFAIAAGKDFLHWKAQRPARKLIYIDGEMSARLARQRLQQAARRHGTAPENLLLINRNDFPNLPPLDTPEGQQFIDRLIADHCDMVTFDNVQSLVSGVMKDEEPWAAVLPWIRGLTRRGVGQLWEHHTGHDETRSYGTKTREWQLDTVMLMKVRATDETLIDFDLEFPKARERSPENRSDFTTAHIWIGDDDQWRSSIQPSSPATTKRLLPEYQKALDYLADVLRDHDPTLSGVVPIDLWRERLQQRGLYDASDRDRKWFERVRKRLVGENRIFINAPYVGLCNKRDAT